MKFKRNVQVFSPHMLRVVLKEANAEILKPFIPSLLGTNPFITPDTARLNTVMLT